jgi:monovalent cation:H+ antiporter-2, CPA2 family
MDLLTTTIIVAACAAVAALTLRLRQSVIIGYLLAGALIGPSGLGWVTGEERIGQLGELGVVFLLFLLGTEISPERMRPLARPALLGGTLQVLLTIAAGMGLARLIGWDLYGAAYFGCVIALSSTAIVVKLLSASDELRAPQGKFSLGVLLFQDAAVVPMMVILPALASPDGAGTSLLIASAKAIGFLGVSFVAAHWLFPPLLERVAHARSAELFTLTVLALALGMAVLSQALGLSLAMGAFVAGLTLGRSPFSNKIFADVLPFRDAFLSVFFVSIGMLLDWRSAAANLATIAVMVASIITVKTLVCAGVGRLLGLPLGMAIHAGLALSQVGEFSFILARMGQVDGKIDEGLYQIVISSSVVTMALTPWLARLGTAASRLGVGARMRKYEPAGEQPQSGHVVICGFGPVGQLVAAALREVGIPFVVIELNPGTVARARREGAPVLYGDARSDVILQKAGIDRARGLVVAIPSSDIAEGVVRNARLRCPALPIYARAVFQPHIRRLESAGATVTVHDEREAGRAIVRAVLETAGEGRDAVEMLLGKLM